MKESYYCIVCNKTHKKTGSKIWEKHHECYLNKPSVIDSDYLSIRIHNMASNYNNAFPKFSMQAPLCATNRWIYGVWIIGNDYKNKQNYYGEYPPTFLKRVYSLFDNIRTLDVLHLFSGSLSEKDIGDKFDINPDTNPTYVGDANNLSNIVERKYDVIFADPPYSEEDALHYGVSLISRNKVVKECYKILKPCGILVWLDQVYPMYRKVEMKMIGTIGVIRSTNHRVRFVFIWMKIQN